MDTFDEAYWEKHYSGRHGGSGHGPSPLLIAAAAPLPSGAALDAGCGEGANARWLAARGWRVTAVDIATTALRRAREHADSMGPDVAGRIDWRAEDLTRWAPPEGQFDLVCALYVHVAGSSQALFRRLAAAVAPGGTLLVIGHFPGDDHGHAPEPGSFVTPDEIVAALDATSWDIVVADTTRQNAHDAVVRARRLA